jgi:hypothetical protein
MLPFSTTQRYASYKMSDKKSTKLTVREDQPTGIASSAFGSNVDALGFNILFIAARNPKLAVEIMELYAKAQQIQTDDPLAPDEDFALFTHKLADVMASESSDKS